MNGSMELFNALQTSPHNFLQPSLPLYTDTVAYLKNVLDPVAADVSAAQQQRQLEARKKRKRGDHISDDEVLRLKQIHTQGFTAEQVWEQARRVIDGARREAERGLAKVRERGVQVDETQVGLEDSSGQDEDLGVEGVDYEIEGVDEGEEEYEGESEDLEAALDGAEAADMDDYVSEGEDIEMDGEDGFDDGKDLANEGPAEEYVSDKFGLNDGFFSIDDFNKRSDFLEQQDVRGDDDAAASDEEDVDWDADPLGSAAIADGDSIDGTDDADEEDGPTFGDPDALSEDEDEDGLDVGEMDAIGSGLGNTNAIMYADFFAPPAQKKRKNKKGRPNPHNFPAQAPAIVAADNDDVERTISAVHRDLFEDDQSDAGEDAEDAPPGLNGLDPSDPKARRSTHERRRLALAEEIRKLEAANVAKREWTLSGEARAADRPLNSLLEEDLEFERAGKPVPVITAEVSESIEDLIKRRILAFDFQDLIRRRPDDMATGVKRGRMETELDDTNRNRKGLAEEYEEEHLRRTDPAYVSASDEKTKKEELEILALWNKVRSALDSLSSWHFRPKAPAPNLEVRVDAPVVRMEDARPSAGGNAVEVSQLAPQEVYRAGEAVDGKAEVVQGGKGKGGVVVAREEMTADERKRRRRREKERIRKAGGAAPVAGKADGAKKGKGEMVKELKRGGVKIIGRKGDVVDVEGRKTGGGGQPVGGGRFKL
ncbi:hypothetical protein BAUCODRAFT_33465 [Baudoinia panamericana UAMH 10762]|uniref:U3 small nucleolar ribonucleoprotein protein MPP10 n=1 Tax=Baudoinia panamericana (strain UAMH 10762) TaxID=717646 RepID=M2N1C1_BAUPA|nr:uncharacterized protein BAUCODRAFT_33465 [Baudoinia panamericana UAMH 10762]EMC97738.1 hypothetical protein BAUCODRAFT_33465 [Baudoinia panamericana UAMH 10762]